MEVTTMRLNDKHVLAHLVAAHCGDLRGWPEAQRMCDGKTYDSVAQFDDADDADALSEAILDAGWEIACDTDFVKGVYTLFFTISPGKEMVAEQEDAREEYEENFAD
jgi:hypothetical protein